MYYQLENDHDVAVYPSFGKKWSGLTSTKSHYELRPPNLELKKAALLTEYGVGLVASLVIAIFPILLIDFILAHIITPDNIKYLTAEQLQQVKEQIKLSISVLDLVAALIQALILYGIWVESYCCAWTMLVLGGLDTIASLLLLIAFIMSSPVVYCLAKVTIASLVIWLWYSFMCDLRKMRQRIAQNNMGWTQRNLMFKFSQM